MESLKKENDNNLKEKEKIILEREKEIEYSQVTVKNLKELNT